jgi:hypothetical protein
MLPGILLGRFPASCFAGAGRDLFLAGQRDEPVSEEVVKFIVETILGPSTLDIHQEIAQDQDLGAALERARADVRAGRVFNQAEVLEWHHRNPSRMDPRDPLPIRRSSIRNPHRNSSENYRDRDPPAHVSGRIGRPRSDHCSSKVRVVHRSGIADHRHRGVIQYPRSRKSKCNCAPVNWVNRSAEPLTFLAVSASLYSSG